jgi:hypothetical protein
MILRPFVRRCLSISVYFRQRDGLLREAPRQRHALYPRGRRQWGSRVTPRGSFISTNGPASHRISVIDALVRPKKGPSDGETRPKATAFYGMEAYEDRRGMRMTARKPKRTAARKRTTARKPKRTTARNIELYSSAYRIAWNQISPVRKVEQPDISLRLHASIRRQLKKGKTDPLSIAAEALKAVDEGTEPGTPKTQES